jgi:hypothetical protein
MQITVNIPDEMAASVEAHLSAEAKARGVALDRYLLQKLVGLQPVESAGLAGRRSIGEAIDAIRELRKGNNLNGLRVKDLIDEGRKF